MSVWSWIRRPRVAASLLAFGGYLAIARAVDNLYPFSTFSMYSTNHAPVGSRIVVREGDAYREIDAYARLACDGDLRIELDACPDSPGLAGIAYLDRAARDALEQRRAAVPAGAREVAVVRRIAHFDRADAPPVWSDCELLRCRAEPR